MTPTKIFRALEKAALTQPKDAEVASYVFMEAIGTKENEEGTSFEAGFYCASPGDDSEEKLVRGWLSEARTLKRQCEELQSPFIQHLSFRTERAKYNKLSKQYRAELRKLASRIKTTIETHEP